MMNIKLLLVAISTAFLGLISSCDTQKQPDYSCTADNSVLFPNDPKERFFFKTGSYWIYENENNPSIIDSCYVKNYFSQIEPPGPDQYGVIKTKKCYERLHMEIVSPKYGNIATNGFVLRAIEGFTYEDELFKITTFGLQTNYITFCLADLLGNEYDNRNCENNHVFLTDSIKVNNIKYTNVLTIDRVTNTDGAFNSIWIAKNIGPVKMIRRDGSTWNLIRYKVIQ